MLFENNIVYRSLVARGSQDQRTAKPTGFVFLHDFSSDQDEFFCGDETVQPEQSETTFW